MFISRSLSICCVFCSCFFLFFTYFLLLICCCYVCAQFAGGSFLSFARVFGDCWFVFAFVRLWVWFLRRLVHVLCACCSFSRFFGKMRLNMMCREISRPPGPPNHACLRPPLSILPIFRVITHRYTHMHPSAPIFTLNMLIIVWYIHMIE